MPIFFHLESHLWIAYLLFFNGYLLSLLFAGYSDRYARLTQPLEAKVIAGFALSLALNGALLFALDFLGIAWSQLRFGLPFVSVVLLGLVLVRWQKKRIPITGEFSAVNLLIYCAVFLLLFYNGGLIEQIADSWWHMSLANKMSYASSFTLEQGHLDGISSRYYPPLWHANLALIKLLSGESLPIIWNSFTAWGAVLKVMAYYLFGRALSRDRMLATLACALFILLPGMGVSYLRVSAWPSHIAYVLWFSVMYVVFSILSHLSSVNSESTGIGTKVFLMDLLRQRSSVLAVIVLVALIALTHIVELVWLFAAMVIYLTTTSLHHAVSGVDFVELQGAVLRWFNRAALLVIVVLSFLLMHDKRHLIEVQPDRLLAYGLPLVLIVLFFVAEFAKRRVTILTACLTMVLLTAVSISYTHLASLLAPELVLPRGQFHESASIAVGFLGSDLSVPGWHLQLRSALLYSGLIAIPASVLLMLIKPNRLTLFLSGNALLAFTFCVSPYLYQWLTDLMHYHSSWRISLLIFTPLIFSAILTMAWRSFTEKEAAA